MSEPDAFRFGSFRLLIARRELLFQHATVALGSRAFDLLVALVKRRGRLATKDELMAEVWPSTIVDENNFEAQIAALRKVLGADPELSRCLQTIQGRGYSFVAKVEIEVGEGTSPDASAIPGRDEETRSIVVLPFANLSNDVEQAHFAQGMTETVTTEFLNLGIAGDLDHDRRNLQDKAVDIRQVGRELGVRFALKGSIQRDDRHVRISAQLSDARNSVQIWSEIFDGEDISDLFDLQDQITGRIANSIGRQVFVAAARDEARGIGSKSWNLVMRGIAADSRPQSLESLRQQEDFFSGAAHSIRRIATRGPGLPGHRASVNATSRPHSVQRGCAAARHRGGRKGDSHRACQRAAHLAMSYLHFLRGDLSQFCWPQKARSRSIETSPMRTTCAPPLWSSLGKEAKQ